MRLGRFVRAFVRALATLRFDPATGGQEVDNQMLVRFIGWNFKPWAYLPGSGGSQVPAGITQSPRDSLWHYRLNQKDVDFWLATAAIDYSYVAAPYNDAGYVSAKLSLLDTQDSFRDELLCVSPGDLRPPLAG